VAFPSDPPATPDFDTLGAASARATRALEDAVVLVSVARPGEPRYQALLGNVRTTATELARVLVANGVATPGIRAIVGEVVTRGAQRGRFVEDRVLELLAMLDRTLRSVLDQG
jgi:endonuclease YncB( thermonuclease family)